MNKWKKWNFWRRARNWCQKHMRRVYMEGGNCDSACPRCHQWESLGNIIETHPLEDGSEWRICSNCKYEWQALFTPAGFVPVNKDVQ